MKRIKYMKLIIWLLIITLLGSVSIQAKPIQRSDISFREMQYEKVDTSEVDLLLDTGKKILEEDNEELIEKWEIDYLTTYYKIKNNAQLAYLYYELDHTDTYFYNEYLYCLDLISKMKAEYLKLSEEEEDSENMKEYYKISADRQELIDQYNRLYYGVKIEYEGKSLGLMDILKSGSISKEKKKELINGPWYDIYNQKCAEVFSKLIKIDIELAKLSGENSVAEGKYKNYGRDYTPNEASVFYKSVKSYAPSIYKAIENKNSKGKVDLMSYSFKSDDKLMQTVQTSFVNEYPQLKESYDYLLKYGLYDICPNSNKTVGGFTTYLDAYNEPFISLNYDIDYQTLSAFIHEFGHFNFEYYAGTGNENLDLAEVYSQGLELLAFPYHKKILGSIEKGNEMQLETMSQIVRGIIDGCIFDEFLQKVYANPEMTGKEMNVLYGQISKEYGLEVDNRSWVEVEHNFSSPFYYMSYSMSAITALEIWQIAQTDEKAAMATYLNLIDSGTKYSFLEALKDVGLNNPLDEKTIKEIMETIGDYYSIDYSFENNQAA